MVSGDAPGSEAVTLMTGKSICGKGAIGSNIKVKIPHRVIATLSKVVATGGRSINNANNFTATAPLPLMPDYGDSQISNG